MTNLETMPKLTKSSKWRNIRELSGMINNDERISYSDNEILYKYDKEIKLSRPVFIEEDLNTNFEGVPETEAVRPLTLFLDAYFHMKNHFNFWASKGLEPTKIIADHIAYGYYDCMSGGFPTMEMVISKYIRVRED